MSDVRHVSTREWVGLLGGGRRLCYGVWDTKENKLVGELFETQDEAVSEAERLDGELRE